MSKDIVPHIVTLQFHREMIDRRARVRVSIVSNATRIVVMNDTLANAAAWLRAHRFEYVIGSNGIWMRSAAQKI